VDRFRAPCDSHPRADEKAELPQPDITEFGFADLKPSLQSLSVQPQKVLPKHLYFYLLLITINPNFELFRPPMLPMLFCG
jgi:hypothetical protein